MATDVRVKQVEKYLNELDNYLIVLGVDHGRRLNAVEEVADALLTEAGVEPVDEFGPAEDYARELATALGVKHRSAWRTVPVATAGYALALFGGLHVMFAVSGGLNGEAPESVLVVSVDELTWLVLPALPVIAVMLSPRWLRNWVIRWAYVVGLALAVAVSRFGSREWFPLYWSEVEIEFGSPFLAVAVAVGVTAVGFGLLWASGLAGLVARLLAGKYPPTSRIRYNPVGWRRISVYRQPPPPAPPVPPA